MPRRGTAGTGIEAIQAHNALISGTRHTVPHTHSCGHLTLRHFVAFAYAWGPCGVYATSGTWNNYRAAAAAATGVALVLKKSRGKGRGAQKQCLGAIKTQAIKWIFMPHFRNACSVAHISRLPFLFFAALQRTQNCPSEQRSQAGSFLFAQNPSQLDYASLQMPLDEGGKLSSASGQAKRVSFHYFCLSH